jgi:DNA processing protein
MTENITALSKLILSLNEIDRLGLSGISKIYRSFIRGKTWEEIKADFPTFVKNCNTIPRVNFTEQALKSAMKTIPSRIESLQNRNIQVLTIADESYPAYLTKLPDGDIPIILYYQGNINLLDKTKNIAVIGTSDPSPMAIEFAKLTTAALVQSGFNIVSGLAKGCDTIAHTSCLTTGGKTIAILPCDLTNIFPSENSDLAKEIKDHDGLLISEYYDTGKVPISGYFVKRDRLQAAMSSAVVLIAAKDKSGSTHAMEKGREYNRILAVTHTTDPEFDLESFQLNRIWMDRPGVINLHITKNNDTYTFDPADITKLKENLKDPEPKPIPQPEPNLNTDSQPVPQKLF